MSPRYRCWTETIDFVRAFPAPGIRYQHREIPRNCYAALALAACYVNTDKIDRFLRSATRALRTRKFLAHAIAFLLCSGIQGGGLAAESPQENAFLRMSPDQRYRWVHGAILTSAHLVATYNKARGDCMANYYTRDKDTAQKTIEETMAKYPSELPTTIILSVLEQACGPLAPRQSR